MDLAELRASVVPNEASRSAVAEGSFDPTDEKARRIEEVADRARAEFGPRAVLPGSPAA
ncbi:hypothetical protein [Streptomyces wedmorensis]|uniref:hypothetical protein n=1 Tax=Streptomyces wedmorensis TaxID=43759 RepID=UPI0037A623D5